MDASGWVKLGIDLLPSVVGLVESLVKAGHSPEEAREIVKRDLESRQAEYEREKAEDEQALGDKHGRG